MIYLETISFGWELTNPKESNQYIELPLYLELQTIRPKQK